MEARTTHLNLRTFRFGFPELGNFFKIFKKLMYWSNEKTEVEKGLEDSRYILTQLERREPERKSPYRASNHIRHGIRKYEARVDDSVKRREAAFLRLFARALEELLDTVYIRLNEVDTFRDYFSERQKAIKNATRKMQRKKRKAG